MVEPPHCSIEALVLTQVCSSRQESPERGNGPVVAQQEPRSVLCWPELKKLMYIYENYPTDLMFVKDSSRLRIACLSLVRISGSSH